MADETAEKQGKSPGSGERSPNYPAIPIHSALGYAQKLWANEKRTAVPLIVAAKAMDYGALSGTARSNIAALRQYGLVDTIGENVRLSDLAMSILHNPPESAERAEALRTAAMKPALFRQLAETHRDASDAALRAFLLTQKGFSEEGAGRFIRAFRASLALDSGGKAGYTDRDKPASANRPPITNAMAQIVVDSLNSPECDPRLKEAPMPSVGQDAQPFDLPVPLIGGGTAILRMPRPISGEDYDQMVAFLETNLKVLRKAFVRDPVVVTESQDQ